MAFSDPISTAAPGYANKTNKVTNPGGNSWWGPNIAFPFPTNAWFMDFVLPGTTDMVNSAMDRRTSVWPYMVRAQNDGLAFNRPFIRKYPDGRTLRNEHQINYDATATNWGWTSDQSPAIWRYLDLTFKCTETLTSRYLDRFDQLTATLKWNVDGTHYMEAPIVKGMPYVTMRYTALTPKFETNNTDYHSIAAVNGSAPSGTVSAQSLNSQSTAHTSGLVQPKPGSFTPAAQSPLLRARAASSPRHRSPATFVRLWSRRQQLAKKPSSIPTRMLCRPLARPA